MKDLYKKYKDIKQANFGGPDSNSILPINCDVIAMKTASLDGKVEIEAKAGDWIFETEDGIAFVVKKEVVDEYYDEIKPITGDVKKARICPFDEKNKHEEIKMVGIEKWFSPKPPVYYGKQLKGNLKTHIDYKKGNMVGITNKNEFMVRDMNSSARFIGGPLDDKVDFNVCKSNQLPEYKNPYQRSSNEPKTIRSNEANYSDAEYLEMIEAKQQELNDMINFYKTELGKKSDNK